MFKAGIVVLGGALAVGGCVHIPEEIWKSGPVSTVVVDVAVDALAGVSARSKRTYFLVPGNENVDEGDLQFREYANYVERALVARGFTPASDRQSAEVAIALEYGIGDPQTFSHTRSIPIFGQTGVSSSRTYGTVTPNAGGGASYSGTTYNSPQWGITGFSQRTETQTYYVRYARITGYDWMEFRDSQRQAELWKTTITSAGHSVDLRMVFPMMIGAAMPYLAEDTGQRMEVQIGDKDEALAVVRGLPPSASDAR